MFYVAYETVKELLCAYPVLNERALRQSFTECVIFPSGKPKALVVNSALSAPLKAADDSWQTVRCYVVKRDAQCPITAQIRNRYRSKTMSDVKVKVVKQAENDASYSDDSLFNISTWGVDMSFRELITMYDENELLKPELQRKYVWSKEEASRFVDSLLLGLPVPSIFLAKVGEDRLIIDGYQRIMTVYDYVKGFFSGDRKKKVFALSNSEAINQRWRGKAFVQLTADEQKRIRTYTIHATIFEQKQPRDDTGMYQIFERINSSGRVLKPQEIRNCVYHGKFNTFLMSLNRNQDWRFLFGSEDEESRMADVELLLRFFAIMDCRRHNYELYEVRSGKYSKVNQISLKKYLNEYMGRMNSASDEELLDDKQLFEQTMSLIRCKLGSHAFRNLTKVTAKRPTQQYTTAFHPALFDAVAQAAAMSIESGKAEEAEALIDYESRHRNLLNQDDFKDCISVRTTNVDRLKRRIQLASEALFPTPQGE